MLEIKGRATESLLKSSLFLGLVTASSAFGEIKFTCEESLGQCLHQPGYSTQFCERIRNECVEVIDGIPTLTLTPPDLGNSAPEVRRLDVSEYNPLVIDVNENEVSITSESDRNIVSGLSAQKVVLKYQKNVVSAQPIIAWGLYGTDCDGRSRFETSANLLHVITEDGKHHLTQTTGGYNKQLTVRFVADAESLFVRLCLPASNA